MVDYRLKLAKRMLFNKKGSLIGAVLAVTIGILVLHVNFVIFQGLYDAFIRDLTEYSYGDILVTDESNLIEKSDTILINWFSRIPDVQAAAPRFSSNGEINITKSGGMIETNRVPLLGVDPIQDIQASTAHKTVAEGSYVFSQNSIVLGSSIVRDLGGVRVGDSIEVGVVNRWGQDEVRRFIVSGIAATPGGQGLDYSAVVHIDTLRDMLDRKGYTSSIMVKLHDPTKAESVRDLFLASFPNDDFVAETIEESAEQQLAGFRSGIAMINMIGYFGMMSSAFAIVTIQMMLVNGKTKEIGIMRSIGARRKDILVIFIMQGILIGFIGAAAGTGAGLAYTFYAKETKLTFNNSIPLEVTFNWPQITQTALTAFGLAVLASLYPSFRATRLLPVEAMRYV